MRGEPGPHGDPTLEGFGIRILWHPALSTETAEEAAAILEAVASGRTPLHGLCIEGAVPRGPAGTGRFHVLGGTGRAMLDRVRTLAPLAHDVLAVGTSAAYGGVSAAGSNPADAAGLQYDGHVAGGILGGAFRARAGRPVINVAGCPTHPNWVTETLMMLAAGALAGKDLDGLGRPRFYADHLVHQGCPRNEFYEFKASAERLSDRGCMMEHLGCVGTQAHADCNTRTWNGEGPCTRVVGRLLEIARTVPALEAWAAALAPGAAHMGAAARVTEGRGAGLVEAARGALGHFLAVREGRIANDQILAPTTWNFSPRDAAGVPGPLEAALVGTPVGAVEGTPVAVQHVVRSFDPCMVCAVR